MIYTCYEMLADCRAGKPEGWRFLIANYVPVLRKLVGHYAPADPELTERVLMAIRKPGAGIFETLEPSPERWFLAELRQRTIAALPPAEPEIDLTLETVAEALEPTSLTEKQTAWIETMHYSHETTGKMLRMAPKTVEKMREKAAGLIRGKVDTWSRTMLADNGPALGRAAASGKTKDCLDAKTFLDVLDGRTTWRGREELERHVNRCWHCIDHFCRMAEIVEVLRGLQPLTPEEAAPWEKMLEVQPAKKPVWKRLLNHA